MRDSWSSIEEEGLDPIFLPDLWMIRRWRRQEGYYLDWNVLCCMMTLIRKACWKLTGDVVFLVHFMNLIAGPTCLLSLGCCMEIVCIDEDKLVHLESSLVKIFTIDHRQRKSMTFANTYYLCVEDEDFVDHLFLHCAKTRLSCDLLFTLFGTTWVVYGTMEDTLMQVRHEPIWLTIGLSSYRSTIRFEWGK